MDWLAFLGGMSTAFIIVTVILAFESEGVSKRELFERGYMVQCIGKSGYYWECE